MGGWVQRFFLSARRLSLWESRVQLPCLFVPDTAAGRLAGHVGTLPSGNARNGAPALNHIKGTPLITQKLDIWLPLDTNGEHSMLPISV